MFIHVSPHIKTEAEIKSVSSWFQTISIGLTYSAAWPSHMWYVYSLCYLPCNKASSGVKEQLLSFGDAQYYKLPGSKDACFK